MPIKERVKVACIGAGNVGAAVAQYCAEMEVGNIVLFDVVEGMPQGKALDLMQAAPTRDYSTRIVGTNDYRDIAGSDICVVTAGLARKPGMTRLDLLEKNGRIMTEICEKIRNYAPHATVIIVTNPLDVMVYLAEHVLEFEPRRVMGMAGILDSSRMSTFVALELGVSLRSVQTMVLGSHGDNMVPLPDYTTVAGISITNLLPTEKIEELVQRTRQGGGEIVKLLKTGSAFYAPGASAARMVEAIVRDEKCVLPCAGYLTGQYGLQDIYMGVPCVLGRKGVENIIELNIAETDLKALHKSAEDVQKGIDDLKKMHLID